MNLKIALALMIDKIDRRTETTTLPVDPLAWPTVRAITSIPSNRLHNTKDTLSSRQSLTVVWNFRPKGGNSWEHGPIFKFVMTEKR
jgi:hypothetical protein